MKNYPASGASVPQHLHERVVLMYLNDKLSAYSIKQVLGTEFPWSVTVIYAILKEHNVPRRRQQDAIREYLRRQQIGLKQMELPL